MVLFCSEQIYYFGENDHPTPQWAKINDKLQQLKNSKNIKSIITTSASVFTQILISTHRDMFLSDVPPDKTIQFQAFKQIQRFFLKYFHGFPIYLKLL